MRRVEGSEFRTTPCPARNLNKTVSFIHYETKQDPEAWMRERANILDLAPPNSASDHSTLIQNRVLNPSSPLWEPSKRASCSRDRLIGVLPSLFPLPSDLFISSLFSRLFGLPAYPISCSLRCVRMCLCVRAPFSPFFIRMFHLPPSADCCQIVASGVREVIANSRNASPHADICHLECHMNTQTRTHNHTNNKCIL